MLISSLLGSCAGKSLLESLLESCALFSAAQDPFIKAPLFIWLAAVGLLVLTLGIFLPWFVYYILQERRLHKQITRGLRAIKSKYSADLRHGLPQAAYHEIVRLFKPTPFILFWESFNAQLVLRRDPMGIDRYWASAQAETVFNEATVLEPRLNRNFFTAIPGMVTGFGLLCTFVAILFALQNVQLVGKKFTGLDTLVSGLSGKFLSSIAALLAATLFLPCEKCLLHSLTKSLRTLVVTLNALVPPLTPAYLLNEMRSYMEEQALDVLRQFDAKIDEMRSYMEEQTAAFKHFNSDFSTKLKQGVDEGMRPTLDRLVVTVEDLNQWLRGTQAQTSDALTGSLKGFLQNLEQSLTSTLASLSDRFAQTLSGSASQEFDQVVSTMGGTARLLESMNTQFQASQTMLAELVNVARNTTVEQMALGKTQVEELTGVLRGLMTQMHDAADTSVTHIATTLTAVLQELSARVTELGQQMSQTVTASAGEATGVARAVIDSADRTLTELVNLTRNTTVEQMALGKTQVEELTTVVRGLMTQMQGATDTSVQHIAATLTTVVQNLSTQVTELGQQMSQTVTASAGEAIGAARAVIERADQWSTRSAAQLAELLEKHHGQLDRVQDVQQTLDATLGQFKGTLTEYATITRNLSQIAAQTNAMVTGATNSTKAMQETGEAIGHVAQLAASQVESFRGIVGSMQRYEEVFRRVEETAGTLLVQIQQHLHNYQATTQQGFDRLTSTANDFLTDATSKLGTTVNELAEYLQDLTGILDARRPSSPAPPARRVGP